MFWKTFLWFNIRFHMLMLHPMGRVVVIVLCVVVNLVLSGDSVFAADGQSHGDANQSPPPPAAQATKSGNPDLFDRILLWFAELALMIATLLSKLVIQIIQAMLPVMTYNNFTNSPIVNAGWAIMRDTVNMFFVIVLIVIAFGTIFGHSKFQWQKQVPRLLIFAIVINFSKTLVGIMIDFGQVIMLTFANALTQIAAGNFVQLLGFTEIYAIGTNNQTYQDVQAGVGTGPQPFDFFFASVASVFLMLIVLSTMVIMLAILVYRVIMLWVMIVLAPLAWFAGGASDIIKTEAYGKWWERFKCLVAIGPVLTFFLWLTLAVAGAGNIAAKSGFDVAAQGALSNPGGIINKIFELDRFMSFIIAIAMLFAGFEAAQQICSTMPGLKNIKGAVTGLAKSSVAKAARVGAGAGRLGLRATKGVTGVAGREIGERIKNKAGLRLLTNQGRENYLREFSANRGSGMLGRMASAGAERLANRQGSSVRADMAKRGKKFADLSSGAKAKQLARFAESSPSSAIGKMNARALAANIFSDQEALKTATMDGSLKKFLSTGTNRKDLEIDAKTNPKLRKQLTDLKKTHPQLFGTAGQLQSQDFGKLGEEAYGDAGVRAQAAKVKAEYIDKNGNAQVHQKDGKDMMMDEAIRDGKYGSRKAELFNAKSEEAFQGLLMARMDDHQLTQVSASVLATSAPEAVLNRAMDQAMNTGEMGKLEQVMAELIHVMRDESASNRNARFDAMSKFDNLTARMTAQASLADKTTQTRTESLVKKARGMRNNAIGEEGSWDGKSQPILDYGKIPMDRLDRDPRAFIQQSFGNASKSRLESAKKQIDDQLTPAADQLVAKEDMLKLAREQAREKQKNSLEYGTVAHKKAELDDQLSKMSPALLQMPVGAELKKKRDGLDAKLGEMVDKDPDVIQAKEALNNLATQLESLVIAAEELNAIRPVDAPKEEPKRNQAQREAMDKQSATVQQIRESAGATGRGTQDASIAAQNPPDDQGSQST